MRRVKARQAEVTELLLAIDPPRGVRLEPGQEWFDFMGGDGAGVVLDAHGREVRRYSRAEVQAMDGGAE